MENNTVISKMFLSSASLEAAANCRGYKKFVQRLQKAFNLFFDLFIFELIESGKNVFFCRNRFRF